MKILHINRNYVTSPLHPIMMSHLEKCEMIKNTVFAPTDLSVEQECLPLSDTEVCVNRCFKKQDRLCFDVKQRKIKKALEKNLDVSSFDCMHAYTLFTDGNCAMKLSEKYEIPYIVSVRNTDVNDFFKKLPYLRGRGIRIMEKASAICFLSESYKKRVFDQFVPDRFQNELEKKSYVIPNGIDNFWLENIDWEKRGLHTPLRLIYAGRIDANKNIQTTIEAVSDMKRNGIEANLTVVGEIIDDKVFQKIKSFVCYREAVPKEKLIDFYRSSDIFVMPSFTESFGLVYAEAMSQRLPVIYSKGEGFDHQFPEGKVGYHVNPRDSKDIVSAISAICRDYSKISESAAEAAKKFNWTHIVPQYRELYEKIINSYKRK